MNSLPGSALDEIIDTGDDYHLTVAPSSGVYESEVGAPSMLALWSRIYHPNEGLSRVEIPIKLHQPFLGKIFLHPHVACAEDATGHGDYMRDEGNIDPSFTGGAV